MQQLEQRMQILNETPSRGGPNTPHSLGTLCPPLLPIRDAAAAEPWARASQQACLEGRHCFISPETRQPPARFLRRKIPREDGSACTPRAKGKQALSQWKEAGRAQGALTRPGSLRPAHSTRPEMQRSLRAASKPLGRPLPQQISVNPSSCRRSGRRRSAISLEAGGPGPLAAASSLLPSCSVF